MRHVLPLATLVFLIGSAAFAQVEPRMVGDWHLSDSEQSLHIQSDGRYQSKVQGRVVDSGKISATNGMWKLKSDNGRADTGTVSFISGNMALHGGLAGSWSRSSSSATAAFSKSAVHQTLSAPIVPAYKPNYASSPPETNSPPQDLNPPSAAGSETSPTYATGTSMNAQGTASGVAAGAPKKSWKSMAQQALNLTDKAKQLMGAPPTAVNGNNYTSSGPQQNDGPPPSSQTYSSMYGHGNANLPGYSAPSTSGSSPPYPSQGSASSNSSNSSYASDPHIPGHHTKTWMSPYWRKQAESTGAPIINADEVNRVGKGMPYNQTTEYWEHVQQQNRPASPGWQTMPRGGYIPVMKDNKARKFWGH